MTSRERIYNDLKKLGLAERDTVIVHSSLSSMGNVEGGAETVIAALSDVIGNEGTLLFPAFTYEAVYNGETFIQSETPVCVGKIPETFRKTDGVIRSFHPTHSVLARGKYAYEMTRDHEKSNTPLGKHSPYGKLYEYGAKILMLGCSLSSMSYIHALEEEANSPYALTKSPVKYKTVDKDGRLCEKEYYKHNFRRTQAPVLQKYAKCLELLKEGDGYTAGEVHGAKSYLIDARAFHDAALSRMKRERYYFAGVKDALSFKADFDISDSDAFDVVILAGQSNAVGFGAGETDDPFTPSDDMLEIKDTYPIAYVADESGKRVLDMPFPPELDFSLLGDRFAYGRWNACLANTFGESYKNSGRLKDGRKLLVVKTAVGGTGFMKKQWTDGGVCDKKMYHMINEALKLSKNMRIVAFLWHQGEADAFDFPELSAEERQERYVENFGGFVARIREKLGKDFPIICGEFSRPWIEKNKIACDAVLSAMRKVIDRDGFGDIVISEGLSQNASALGTTDILHFSRDALHKFGRRYFEAYEKLTDKKSNNAHKQ